MGNTVNFLKKQTVLDNILSNRNVVVVDNNQLQQCASAAQQNPDKYIISYNNVDLESSYTYNNIKALYASNNWLKENVQISKKDFEDNVKYYNNYNKNGSQNLSYTNYSKTMTTNGLTIDSSYDSLYYIYPDKINLMSYSIKPKDGFNYDENNHSLKFNIDNKYIKSICNLLYYNYNNIRNTSSDKAGVAFLDNEYFDIKNYDNRYSENILTINKEFKTEIYSSLNKIKNLYNDCKITYNSLRNQNNLNDSIVEDTERDDKFNVAYTTIHFENPKIYYDDYGIGVDSLDLSNADTLYVFDLNNAEFRIGYTDIQDYKYLENKNVPNTAYYINDENANTYLKNKISLTLSKNDAAALVTYNQYKKYNNIIGTTYNIDLNNVDIKNKFSTNGLSILYKASPYLSPSGNDALLTLPYEDKELNIRKIPGSFVKYFNTTEMYKNEDEKVEYLFVSSYYKTDSFRVPESTFDYLLSKNTITDIFNLQYYSTNRNNYNHSEVYPILNLYPNNYINDKYFNTDLINYIDNENVVAINEELSTCVSKIRDVYVDDVPCLYFYSLTHKDGYYESVGEPNMLIFEEDVKSYLTFIAREDTYFTFTVNEEAENNINYIQYSLDGVNWHGFTEVDNNIDTIQGATKTINNDNTITYRLNHAVENSNKILWRAKFYTQEITIDEDDNVLIEDKLNNENNENNGLLPNLTNGIGIFGAVSSTGDKAKYDIFGNIMSMLYGNNDDIEDNNKTFYEIHVNDEYIKQNKLIDKPYIFYQLFSNSKVESARRLALPAITLEKSNYCYSEMFYNCDELSDCPELPAEILSDRCYKGMFKNCASMKSTPKLNAPVMKPECYKEMFYGCKTIVTPPNVTKKYPTGIFMSKELAYGCYESMFENCIHLKVMPQLTSSKMKENCYKKMFMGCKDILKAVKLPLIQEFAKSCFYFMFYGTNIIPNIKTVGTHINLCEGIYFDSRDDEDKHNKFINTVKIGALQGIFGGTKIKYKTLKGFFPAVPSEPSDSDIRVNTDKEYLYLDTYLNNTYNNLDDECCLDMFMESEIDSALYLPATIMKKGCYKKMYYKCKELKSIPKLNIKTSAEECCYQMFYESGISDTVNDLVITNDIINDEFNNEYVIKNENENNYDSRLSDNIDTLAKNCYYQMFYKCTKLTKELKYIGGNNSEDTSCYQMFYQCTSLTTPPQSINVKNMAYQSCYKMFYDCVNVHHIPEMHVDTTAFECCKEMFYHAGNNVNVTGNDAIKINMLGDNTRLSSNNDTLAENCYYKMFYESKINKGPLYIGGNKSEKHSCYKMFYDCRFLTIPPEKIEIQEMAYRSCYKMFYNCIYVHHIPEMHVKSTAIECCREMFENAGNYTNGINMRGNSTLSTNTDTLATACYYQMFFNCNKLINGPIYIGGNDSDTASCSMMFCECISMATPPQTIAIKRMGSQSCYWMFYDCVKLEFIPEMHIDTTAFECCREMFYYAGNNSSNAEVTLLNNTNIILSDNTDTLANKCYYQMFYNSNIKFDNSAKFVINGNNSEISACESMFENCQKLICTPILNTKSLGENSYKDMFRECTLLKTASGLNAETLSKNCCNSMFYKCTSLTTAPVLPAETLAESCYESMFEECTALMTAPVLPAETLVSKCYDRMFYGCISLAHIEAMFLTAPMNELGVLNPVDDEASAYATDEWVNGVYTSDINENDELDAWENYTRNYSEHNNIQIDFDDLISKEGNVIPPYIFIRNSNATWDVRYNIGRDGIPENWQIFNENDEINRLSPVFIFFYSDSNRNFEDYSKLIYGFNGDDCTNKIPVYDATYISRQHDSSKPNEFCRRGYTFNGWRGDDQSDVITYINGQYSTLMFTGQDKHYFAIWNATEYPIYWYYFTNDLYATTTGNYDSLISDHKPNPMPDIDSPIPTHHYPDRDGFIFVGWNSQENQREENFYRNVSDVDTNGNITQKSSNLVGYVGDENGQPVNENIFYAVWKYIVKWNVNGGKYSGNSSDRTNDYFYQTHYLYNDPLDFPNNNQEPTRDGDYLFGGWSTIKGPVGNTPYIPDMYTDNIQNIYTAIQNGNDNTKPTSGINYNVTEPKNYYATWKSAIIWYDGNGEIFVKNHGYYNDKAKNYKPLTNPTYSGRTFIGWNSEQNQREDNLNDIIVHNSGSDDNTIYPVWKYAIIWYTRSTNNSNNGYYNSSQIDNINYFENRYEYNQLYGDILVYPTKNPTRNDEDYKFVGWADYAGPTSVIWKPNMNVNYTVTDSDTFYAVYQPAITWHYFENTSKTYGYFNDYVKNYKPNNPSRDRYIFIGWNTNNNQRVDNITNKTIANPSLNHIYAVWYYSVKWNTYGGSYSTTGNGYYNNYYYQDNYLYNDILIFPNINPTRSEYSFDGWANYAGPQGNNIWQSNINSNSNVKVTNSIDLYSVWKPAIYWYDYNGNLLATTYGYYNDNVTNYKPADPSRTGYTFNGWNTSSGQTANNVKVGNPSNNKFYAVYSANKCTIYWYNHDGTVLLATNTGDYDSLVSLYKPNDPTREGYTFQGWNTNKNQTSGNIDNIRVKTSGNNFYAAYTVNRMTVTFKVAGTNYTYINSSGTTVISTNPNYGTSLGNAVNPWPTAKGSSQYEDSTRWKKEGTTEEVTAQTIVKDNMTLVPIDAIPTGRTVTFTVVGTVYEYIDGINATTYSKTVEYGTPLGQIIDGLLPRVVDTDNMYKSTRKWKKYGTDEEVNEQTPVTSDMTLVPIPELKKFTVTFTVEGTEYEYIFENNEKTYSVSSVEYGTTLRELIIADRLPNLPQAIDKDNMYEPTRDWKILGEDEQVDMDEPITKNITLIPANSTPIIYSVKFTVEGTEYDHIGEYNDETSAYQTGITWSTVAAGTTLGELLNDDELPQAVDIDNKYKSTIRWKIYGTDEEVYINTPVTSNMTLVPILGDINKFTVTFTVQDTEYDHIGEYNNEVTSYRTKISWSMVAYGTTLGELLNDNELPQAVDIDNIYESTSRWKNKETNIEVYTNTSVTSDITLVPVDGNPIPFIIRWSSYGTLDHSSDTLHALNVNGTWYNNASSDNEPKNYESIDNSKINSNSYYNRFYDDTIIFDNNTFDNKILEEIHYSNDPIIEPNSVELYHDNNNNFQQYLPAFLLSNSYQYTATVGSYTYTYQRMLDYWESTKYSNYIVENIKLNSDGEEYKNKFEGCFSTDSSGKNVLSFRSVWKDIVLKAEENTTDIKPVIRLTGDYYMSHSNVYAFNLSNGVQIEFTPIVSQTLDQTICFTANVSCTNSKFTIYNVVDKTYVDGVSIMPELGNNVNVETTYPIQDSSSVEWNTSMSINTYTIKQNKTTCSDVIIGQQKYKYYGSTSTTINYLLGFGVDYGDINETTQITIQVNKITIYNLNNSEEESFTPDANGIFNINNKRYSNTTTGTLNVIPFDSGTTPGGDDPVTPITPITPGDQIIDNP